MSLGGATYENPTAPIGSGLLIMVAAGAGYAALRRKRVRKSATLLLATVMLFTLTQCKKKNIVTTNTDEGVFITVNATYGGNKTVFDPDDNYSFTWKEGVTENIYVGGSQHNGYIGVLTGTAGEAGLSQMSFSGTVSVYSNETLYFYYLGDGYELIGKDITSNSPKYYVDFSEQSGTLDDVTKYHIAIGNCNYHDGTTSYNVSLAMAMSIACFDFTGFNDGAGTPLYEDVYIHGDQIVAAATINFRNGTIGINGDEDGRLEQVGYIKCSKVTGNNDNKKYVALLPPTTSSNGATTIKFDSNSKTGSIDFINGIQSGKFYAGNNNYGLNMNPTSALTQPKGIEGTLPGLFSVAGTNVAPGHVITTKMVRFSKGNLQYDKVNDTWSFMDQQYNTVETSSLNVGTDYASQSIVSLFGWGTSGWNNGNLYFIPYNTSKVSSSSYGYGPKNGEASSTSSYLYSLTDDFANSDWGVYNAISNGGNTPGKWRTPTKDELCYMIGVRDDNSIIHRQCTNRFLKAIITIGGTQYKGLIIFPDDFNAGSMVYNYNNYSNYGTDYETGYTPVSADDWKNMKSQCVAFLPAGGSRNELSCSNVNSFGYYWTASHSSYSYASILMFSNNKGGNTTFNGVNPDNSSMRYNGNSVRLVRDVN